MVGRTIPSQTAQPVCLPPWLENPYRLVSLEEIVIAVSAEKWFSCGVAIENLFTEALLTAGPGIGIPFSITQHRISEPMRKKALECLAGIYAEYSRIGLNVAAETIKEVQEELTKQPTSCTWESLRVQLANVREITRKEARSKTFFYIPPEQLRFVIRIGEPWIFGQTVASAFPSTIFDANEAGMCLATSRATACVFHLMRVLERALAALGAVFEVSLSHTNWGPAIDEIESKVRDMHRQAQWKSIPDCKEQQEFYSQAASHFGILKDAWRNYTAHARGKYTEEQATLIFENVKAFIEKLST